MPSAGHMAVCQPRFKRACARWVTCPILVSDFSVGVPVARIVARIVGFSFGVLVRFSCRALSRERGRRIRNVDARVGTFRGTFPGQVPGQAPGHVPRHVPGRVSRLRGARCSRHVRGTGSGTGSGTRSAARSGTRSAARSALSCMRPFWSTCPWRVQSQRSRCESSRRRANAP